MDNANRKCVDCGGEKSAIQIVDKQGNTPETIGFEYAAVDARRGFWSGVFPKSGRVESFLRNDCGSVRFYAKKTT